MGRQPTESFLSLTLNINFSLSISISHFNLKTYYESLITADEFDKNKIDSISCPYNKKISDHCTIQFHESETQQDNTKIKCKVHGCKWKKKLIWLK